jgi:hypothetical protein
MFIFTLVRAMYNYEWGVSENTMFLPRGGAGEGGGEGVEWGGGEVNEKRRFVVCSDCISHARSTPEGRTGQRGFGCVLCHSQPRKIDSGLTRDTYAPSTRSLTQPSHIFVVLFVCARVHGPIYAFLCLHEFSMN